MKPKVKYQGKCVVDTNDAGEFLVMTPDGYVVPRLTRTEAEKECRKWFKKHVPKEAIGVGEIDWMV
jgi:hypothetical protein